MRVEPTSTAAVVCRRGRVERYPAIPLEIDLDPGVGIALSGDPLSAFGGIIALSHEVDGETAEAMAGTFLEVVLAPGFTADAREVFAKKKNLRLLVTDAMPDPAEAGMTFKSIAGGLLLQSRDAGRIEKSDLKVVTKRAPSEAELADLLFAFRVGKHVKSNTIVYAKDGATVGIGAGQMSRVYSTKIAAIKAEDEGLSVKDSVMASDAFFPFRDGIDTAAAYGISAIIQPGGSMRDDEVIAAADEHGLAMVFTGMRHFRH